MRKVYIITFHCAQNVGAMLQSYALSHTIQNMGKEVTVIDYRPPKVCPELFNTICEALKKNKLKKIIGLSARFSLRFLKNFTDKKRHIYIYGDDGYIAFCKFMTKKMNLTPKVYYDEKELKRDFSEEDAIFITGSDQVWNPILSQSPEVYLLDFVQKGKKNSYGASFGTKDISEEFASMLKKSTQDYEIISVREKSGVDIIKKYTGKEAAAVLDPVFLLDKKQWLKLAYKVPIYEKYIFVYRTESNEKINECIEKIKQENPGIKVVKFDYISDELVADYEIPRKSPVDFVSYLFNAEYVVTNSFHGTAFSVISGKKALIVPHSSYNERISSLMGNINVELNEKGIYETNSNCYARLDDKMKFSKEILLKIVENK